MASLVSAAELAEYEAGDAQTYLDIAATAVQSYCGWHIAPLKEDHVLTMDGNGSRHLWLPSLLVVTVTSVVNDGETLDSTMYDWSESGFIELREGCWSKRARGITVTLTHGYESVPEDLAGVIMAAASRAKASPNGAYLQRAGAVQMQWRASSGSAIGSDFLNDERTVLNKYKLPPRQ